mmetsp:Transcript_16390/g.41977  ORF Transcript_16390/g.41977 Transcript_16390/m.41977 type:complete len:215 (-) Transcript_16390:834-1478(-)
MVEVAHAAGYAAGLAVLVRLHPLPGVDAHQHHAALLAVRALHDVGCHQRPAIIEVHGKRRQHVLFRPLALTADVHDRALLAHVVVAAVGLVHLGVVQHAERAVVLVAAGRLFGRRIVLGRHPGHPAVGAMSGGQQRWHCANGGRRRVGGARVPALLGIPAAAAPAAIAATGRHVQHVVVVVGMVMVGMVVVPHGGGAERGGERVGELRIGEMLP